MDQENVDKAEKAKINQKICVTCRRALSTSDFSYFRSLSGRGSTMNDSCDHCAGILPPEVARNTGYTRKSQPPTPAKLVEGQPIVLDEEAITNLLCGVVAWLARRHTASEREVLGRFLVGQPKSYGGKQNGYSSQS